MNLHRIIKIGLSHVISKIRLEPRVLHDIAVIAHASVLVLVEIN